MAMERKLSPPLDCQVFSSGCSDPHKLKAKLLATSTDQRSWKLFQWTEKAMASRHTDILEWTLQQPELIQFHQMVILEAALPSSVSESFHPCLTLVAQYINQQGKEYRGANSPLHILARGYTNPFSKKYRRGAPSLKLRVKTKEEIKLLREAATTLLRRGADPNARNKKGNTPLHTAAKKANSTMLQLLLEHGAKIKKNKYGFPPLKWAIRGNNDYRAAAYGTIDYRDREYRNIEKLLLREKNSETYTMLGACLDKLYHKERLVKKEMRLPVPFMPQEIINMIGEWLRVINGEE